MERNHDYNYLRLIQTLIYFTLLIPFWLLNDHSNSDPIHRIKINETIRIILTKKLIVQTDV